MTPVQLVESLLEAQYRLGTTDIALPPEFGDFLIQWGDLNIPDDVIHVEEDGGAGREKEIHITVKYGLKIKEASEELRAVAQSTKPFAVKLHNVSLFTTNPKFDVVKLEAESPELRVLNRRVANAVPHEDTHPTYEPHVTLAYVEKGTCDHLKGEDPFQDDVPREFMVSGMNFKARRDSGDQERNQEVLLFTRAKKPVLMPKEQEPEAEEVLEAAVGSPVAQMDLIKDEIKEAARESNGNLAIFLALANEALRPHGIRFERHPENIYHAPAMATEEGAFIEPPLAQDLRDPNWPDRIIGLLYHELVHGHQMSRMSDPKKVRERATAWMTPGGRIDSDRYLQQKQEIMAWAGSLVDSWRRQGLTPDEMMARLRTGRWGYGMKYWANRKRFPQAFNRFVKQATEYIDQMGESAVVVDPFARCDFPVDPERIKQFLRNSSRRREERPIL